MRTARVIADRVIADRVIADRAALSARVRAAGTSFHRGMRVLPPERRAALYAVYAFCREVDDIADDNTPLRAKRLALNAWRVRLAGLDQTAGASPLDRELAAATNRYALRAVDFEAVIDGMQMDAETAIVAPSLDRLDLYCDRVAAAVGRLAVRCFGDTSAAADTVAWTLGRALQLTNIVRDVAEDAHRGRLYLPTEWLAEAGVPLKPHAALEHPRLPEVLARTANAARGFFAAAEPAMDACKPRAIKPARLMGATYAALLEALEARGWTQPAHPVALGRARKLKIVLRYGLFG